MSTRRRRWVREAAAVARRPAATWLALRMLAWSIVLPVLKYVVPLPSLARLMWSGPHTERRPDREQLVTLLARRISRLRPGRHRDNCLERSLLSYRFLSMENADPHVVVGVRKSGDDIVGHAWVTVDGKPLYDAPSSLEQYVALADFNRGSCARLTDGPLRSTLFRGGSKPR